MEFFNNAKAVRLKSHLDKYLAASEDQTTVHQTEKGSSKRARWTVELVQSNPHAIRLISCYGTYLTASAQPFLLGMTGKKVLLKAFPDEWEPIKEGYRVKFRTKGGNKYLRANGASWPWRNTVTHDCPHRTATQDWVMWDVEVVDVSALADVQYLPSSVDDTEAAKAGAESMDADDDGGEGTSSSDHRSSNPPSINEVPHVADSPLSRGGSGSSSSDAAGPAVAQVSGKSETHGRTEKVSGMEFFERAQTVRLRSHHDKYLTADPDEETVVQDSSGASKSVKWTVEFVEGVDNVVRLKSCYGKYLRAMDDEESLLGVTGRKVVQGLPRKLDSSVEWEPIRHGMQVKLKTRYGNFLRANGGLPPWRNSITHDIPHRHHEWILWEVDVIEIRPQSPPKVTPSDSLDEDLRAGSLKQRLPSHVTNVSFDDSPRKSEGRLIYYYIVDGDRKVNDAIEWPSFQFRGYGLEELIQKVEEETGLEDIIVCSRSQVNGRLNPLRLALPPNNATMHVVVIPPTSKGL